MFMDTHCIFDFKYIQLLIGHIAPAEIPSSGDGRDLHIFSIGQRLSQIIFIDNILKRFSFSSVGVAVISRPNIGRNSLMAFFEASA